MSGGLTDVRASSLAAGASNADAVAGAINDRLEALRQYLLGVGGRWHGPASTKFEALMLDYKRNADNLSGALNGIADALRRTAQDYVETETTVGANIDNVHTALPPMRF